MVNYICIPILINVPVSLCYSESDEFSLLKLSLTDGQKTNTSEAIPPQKYFLYFDVSKPFQKFATTFYEDL